VNMGESRYWKLYELMETYRRRLSMIRDLIRSERARSDILEEILTILEGKRD